MSGTQESCERPVPAETGSGDRGVLVHTAMDGAQRSYAFGVGGVRVEIIGDYGHATSIRVVCRRISGAAVHFLHAAAPPVGTRCRIWLPTQMGESVCVAGKINSREESFGAVCEMSLEFDEPLDLRRLGRSGMP